MNIITTLLALFIVLIPLLFLLVLASMLSIVFGLTGILYYLPHLFVLTSCAYYLHNEIIGGKT